jgi:uncharacterized membrane protein YfcA
MRRLAAFGSGTAVGVLGGLIGLGGAEFRLPVLMGLFGLPPHRAVPLNLLISLATIAASAAFRIQLLPDISLRPIAAEIASLTAGAVTAAWWGARILHRLPVRTLTTLIAWLLLALAALLVLDAVLSHDGVVLISSDVGIRALTGIGLGLIIGLISSLLGVAGGELIIPILVIMFGVDVASAGTASLLISMPTVLIGVAYHARRGAFEGRDVRSVAVPMAAGSVVGAFIGTHAARVVAAAALKIFLGALLVVSGLKIMRREQPSALARRT